MTYISPNTELWASLFDLFFVMGASTAALVFGYMVYLVATRREGRRARDDKYAKTSTRRFLMVLVVICVVVGTTLYISLGVATDPYYIPPKNGPHLMIRVYAFRWGWNFTYPDGVSIINTLRVPVNTTIVLNITSVDVFHSLGIPMLDVKADAVPGFWNTLWFVVTVPGNYTDAIRCYELCGPGHAYMTANLDVMTSQSFSAWYAVATGGQ
jgi:cytochrome c oxidase subunit 2